jgi:Asp/Glu/hydantoin racemase
MTRILLINPNTSETTTAQMAAIAASEAPRGTEVIGATARRGAPMILTAEELAFAASEVLEIGLAAARDVDGIIIGAFGDPGLAALRQRAGVPVVGIAEAAMLEAAEGNRRFGVATTTPALIEVIAERAHELGLAERYTGIRLTSGDPMALVADPSLGQAAIAIAARFATPIIAPIPAAMRRLMRELAAKPSSLKTDRRRPDNTI